MEVMNADASGIEVVLLELKYCERCGGLWLRQRDVSGVECAACRLGSAGSPLLRGRADKRQKDGRRIDFVSLLDAMAKPYPGGQI